MRDHNAKMEDVISLNVGGTIFTSTRSTFCQFQNSHLELLVSGRHVDVKKDTKDCIFFDRDPKYFKYVMAYLRGKSLPIKVNEEILKEEFEFYGIPFPSLDQS